MKLVIDIQDDYKRVIDNLVADGKGYLLPYDVENGMAKAVKCGKPLPTLTDPEQRLFLSAMTREEKVCKRIDGDKVPDGTVRMLVPLCQNIERKVKKVLF